VGLLHPLHRVWESGELFQGARAPQGAPDNGQGGGRPGGGGHGVQEPRHRVCFAGDYDYAKAIEYHTQHLAIAKEAGDQAGEGAAYGNLGIAYVSLGDCAKAIEYQAQHLAIAKEVGDRAGEGGADGNLGNAYLSQGDYAKAIEYHAQRLAIAKEVGDRAGEGRAYGNLGTEYLSQGALSKAIEYHTQDLAIAKEVGDRAGEGGAYGNLSIAYQLQGGLQKGHRAPRAAPGYCKGGDQRRRHGRPQERPRPKERFCSEVLQCRSPKDGFEKSRIGRESDDRAAQGYLRSAEEVARCGQRRRVA
jgi:tetratricopeptide (TPR) repeat protein